MQHWLLRCKHCGKAYTFCTYGNKDGCSMDYCGECQTAIDNALAAIPKKIDKKYIFLEDETKKEYLNKIFDNEKENYESEDSFLRYVPIIPDWGFKSVESCYDKGVEYCRCIKNDGTIEFKAAVEYDLIAKKYTGKEYYENEKFRDRHYTPMHQYKIPMFDRDSVPVVPLSPPKGDILSYMMPKNI